MTVSFKGNVGVSTHLRNNTAADQITVAKQIKSYGLDWIREDFLWNILEPSKGTFNWSSADRLMTAVSQAGLNICAILHTSPAWSHPGSDDILKPPNDPNDYANFCVAVLKRYGAIGQFWKDNPALNPRPVVFVELWNEPFGKDFFHGPGSTVGYPAGGPDPASYAKLVFTAATAIRASHQFAFILICGEPFGNWQTTAPGQQFFHQVLLAEPRLVKNNLFDAYTVHPYTAPNTAGPNDKTPQRQGAFDRILDAKAQAALHGSTNKQIWITEFGWTVAGDKPVTEQVQGQYIVQGISRMLNEFGVSKAFIYTLESMRQAPSSSSGYSMLRFVGPGKPGVPVPALGLLEMLLK